MVRFLVIGLLVMACAAPEPPATSSPTPPPSPSGVSTSSEVVNIRGTLWKLSRLDNRSAPTSGPGAAGLFFGESDLAGDLQGTGPCDTFVGAYHAEGDTLAIKSLQAKTRNDCDSETRTLEQRYVDALKGATRWSIVGDQLTLSGNTVLVFDLTASLGG
jgi:putative lipoprotein